MAVSVEVPDLGQDMAGGVVAEWYLADGATVSPGDVVCRLESSFVAVEIEAAGHGILRHQKPAGSIERPGAILGLILAHGEPLPAPHGVSERQQDVLAEAPGETDFAPEADAPGEPAPVVVPFPRRFAPQRDHAWEPAPGDAVAFDSSLFDPGGDPAETLPEPGGSIPGLPLWDPEDELAGAAVYVAPAREARLARISEQAAASASVLSMSIQVNMAECGRLVAACAREWGERGPTPILEDLALRAIAKAMDEAGLPAAACGLLVAGPSSDSSAAVGDPARRSLRDAIAARASGGDVAFESADWVLASLAGLGVSSATPRLPADHAVAFAAGAADRRGVATLTMAYNDGLVSMGTAARVLARARDTLEAPYSMLV